MRQREDLKVQRSKKRFGNTPEGKVKQAVWDLLVRFKEQGKPIWWIMTSTNGSSADGQGDFLCCIDGRLVYIETKAPYGKASDNQIAMQNDIFKARGHYWFVYPADLEWLELKIKEMLRNE